MRLLDKVNRIDAILMATHDQAIVDAMRKRVIELDEATSCATSPVGCTPGWR